MPEWLPPALLAISTFITMATVLHLFVRIGRLPLRFAGPADPLSAPPRPMALPRPLRRAARAVAVAIAANATLALLLAAG